MIEKACIGCGRVFSNGVYKGGRREFDYSVSKRKYCSHECYLETRRKRVLIKRLAIERECTKCTKTKTLSSFYTGFKDGRNLSWCKKCIADNQRSYHLKTAFGISKDEYNKLLIAQHGLCFVCGKKEQRRPLPIDHDHATGTLRGLLCNICNRTIGIYKDNIEIFEKFIKYLKEPPAPKALGRIVFVQNRK